MAYKDIDILYGADKVTNFIPDGKGTVKVIDSPQVESEISDLESDLIERLENPTGTKPLQELIEEHYKGSGKYVCLLADDNTRPNIHTKILYPMILDYLIDKCGVAKEDIRFLVASGTHRPPNDDELEDKIYGSELYNEYKDQIWIHNDNKNLVHLGKSSRGSPIYIDKNAYDSSIIIPVTDSEYHYFAGVAGTVKQLFPGVAGRKTTNTNHPQMFDKKLGFKPECRLGNTKGNPVIEDMKEMAVKVNETTPVFCIDAILDDGEITYVNAGDIIAMHAAGKKKLEPRRIVEVEEAADLVIVTVGELGLNLYQAGKGIHAAWNAAKKPGGQILLLAPCEDGVGSAGYKETMEAVQDKPVDEALKWVINNKCSVDTFKIGNQKPVDLFRIIKTLRPEGKVNLLSEMDPDELKDVYRIQSVPNPNDDPQQALRNFLDNFFEENPDTLVYVLRDAGLYVVAQE